jgi:hypothetical protein
MNWVMNRCTAIAVTALAMTGCGEVRVELVDATPAAAADATPHAAPRHAIASAITLPTSNASPALDLDGDGRRDDELGAVLGALIGEGFEPQRAADRAIDRGAILLLAAYEPGAGAAATFTLWKGASPSPAPCASADDLACRHHLDGHGHFVIAGDSHHDVALDGTATATTFTGGPGSLSLPLVFGADAPFEVTLIGARVEATLDATGMPTIVIGGAIGATDVDGHLVPALASAFQQQVVADCADLAAPPACGCKSGSHGEKAIRILDTTADCAIRPDELRANPTMGVLLAPDVMIAGAEGLSVGVAISTVPATF